MKYDISCKVYSFIFSKMVCSYYKTHFPDMDMKPVIHAVKKEYREMLERTPALSRDNQMAGNLKGAAYFFALAKKVPNMTPALMDQMVLDSMQSDFMMNMHKKQRKNGTMFTEKEQDKKVKDAIRSQSSTDEMDWQYTFEKGHDEYRMTVTKCGVCRLAEKENCMDYLPCMCRMDFPKYKMTGATLDRTKTLANHDDCCNFHLIRDIQK